jgi:hypothetical protein
MAIFFTSLVSEASMFHRYRGVRLDTFVALVDVSPVRSQLECCARCRTIVGCKSVNYRQRRSSTNESTVCHLNVSLPMVEMQQLVSDVEWDWFYQDKIN